MAARGPHGGFVDPETGAYEDLTLWINILYDCQVLPSPEKVVGAVLRPEEVAAIAPLLDVLLPLVERLGRSDDAVYMG